MTSVGDILQSERTTQGRTVAAVAEELCITRSYLAAIEADDVESLPGSFFYKSFVKQYASLLGLDYAKLEPGVDAVISSGTEPEPDSEVWRAASEVPQHSSSQWHGVIRVPDPLLEAANKLDLSGRNLGFPAIAGFIVVLLACSGFYAWWMDRGQVAPDGGETPAAISQVTESADAPASTFASESGFEMSTTEDADGTRRVILNLAATEETWLSITSEGKQVFSGVLQPSETKTVSGVEGARMRVGNAGGIEVRLNGKQIGPIGERGQVRTVEFTTDDYEIVRPVQAPVREPGDTL